MNEEEKLIYEILSCREDHQLLTGELVAVFNNTKDKFFAYSFIDLESIDYEEYSYTLENAGSYSSTNVDGEKQRKYITPSSWQMKSAKECIEEGIYKSCSIQFTGMLYEGEWFILNGLCYSGEPVEKVKAKNMIVSGQITEKTWNHSLFKPHEPTVLLNGNVLRDIELEEYNDIPYIVAEIKKEQKEKLNKAFIRYMNHEIFIPFVKKLKIKYPDEYSDCIGLYGEHYTLIFPKAKDCIIMVFMARTGKKEEYRLQYFLYETGLKKMYHWHYFIPKIYGYSFHYSQEIIEELSTISNWDSYLFLESSRTMDDVNFWNNYVFKKENGNYKYLTEIIL